MWYVIGAMFLFLAYAYYLIWLNFREDKKQDKYKNYRDPVTGLLGRKWKKE